MTAKQRAAVWMARPSSPTWTVVPLAADGASGSLVSRLLFGCVSVAAAAASAGVLLASQRTGSGMALALTAVLVAGVGALVHRPERALATHGVLRMALAVAVGALVAQQAPGERAAGWIAAAGLVVLVGGETLLHRLSASPRLYTSGLPGAPEPRALPAPVWAVPMLWWATVLAGSLLAVIEHPAGWLVLVLVVTVADLVVGSAVIAQVLVSHRARRRLRTAVQDYAPEFILYTSRPDDASYQVTMWLPYLQRTGRRFLVVTRSAVPAQVLAGLTGAPVLACRTSRELEDLLVPSVTTVFYVNASSGNGQMVRHKQLVHVYLGHGDSDKAPSYNPTHAMYDLVFAAGEAAIERYPAHGVHIPRENFAVVGRPQVEQVEQVDERTWRVGAQAPPTVLYAPTWRGHVEETMLYSLPHGVRIVTELLRREVTVVFRPHPFSVQDPDDAVVISHIHDLLARDARASGRQHVYGQAAQAELSVFDCFNRCDAMVSDVSSVVSDFLHSGKPFAMFVPQGSHEQFVEEFPVGRAAYLLDPDLANLSDVLDDVLERDPRADERRAVRVHYLGPFPAQGYAQAFVSEAGRVVDRVGMTRDSADDDEDDGSSHVDDTVDPQDDDHDSDGSPRSGSAGKGSGGPAPDADLDAAAPQAAARTSIVPASLAWQAGDALSVAVAGLAVLAAALDLRALSLVSSALVVAWMCLLWPPWRPHEVSLVGAFGVQRVLLWVAVALLAQDGHDNGKRAVASALAVALFALAVEGWMQTAMTTPRTMVTGLAGLGDHAVPSVGHGLVYPVNVALLALGVLVGATRLSVLWLTALVLVVIVVDLVLVASDVRLVRASDRDAQRLHGALEEYGAQFVVYFAGAANAMYQLDMWMPYFERLDRPFVIVTRTAATVLPISERTTAPVVLCRTLASLDEVLTSRLTTAFYVNNGVKNTHLVEHRELTHVWLNHGDSEKPACFNPVHAIYDRIFAAGQAGVDRYGRHGVRIAPEHFEVVGRPQVERIQVGARPDDGTGSPTVLYAPTWIGPFADTDVYSLPVGAGIVAALLARGCRVIFRAHPLSYRFRAAREHIDQIGELLAADAAATGRQHLWGEAAESGLSIEECFNASDAMVCDVSAVVSDFLYSQKPFSIVAMHGSSERLVAEAPVAVAAYVLSGDLSDIDAVLDDLLVHDPLQEQRLRTKTYYLGDFPAQDYAQGFLLAARQHIDQAPRVSRALARR